MIKKHVTGKSWLVPVLILLVLSYFPLFMHLERLPIRIWDEARLAINAIEMNMSHNYIVTFFDGSPEMWNTKPPLLIWIQTLFIKIFGIRELAVRLPSALAAFFTVILLVAFSSKYIKDFWFGIISSLVLITAYGYVEHHGTRTGDYDSLLTLFTTFYCFTYFIFIQTQKTKYLHLFFIGVTLAVLTKTVQGLFFLPALFLYTLSVKGKIQSVLINKWVYIDSILFVSIVLGYYFTREHYNPGYLHVVYENDLGGRFLNTLENHKHEFMYYFNMLVDIRFSDWYPLLLPGLLIGLTIKNKQLKNITVFSSINIVAYWFIISTAQTKLEWYDLPLFPFLSVLVAMVIYWIFIYLKNMDAISNYFAKNLTPFIFLFILFLHPYEKITDKVYFPEEKYAVDNRILYFLRDLANNSSPAHQYDVCWDDSQKAHIMFYVYKIQAEGRNCSIVDCKQLKPGQEVIVMKPDQKDFIEKNYTYELLETYYEIKTYRINGTNSKG